MDVAVSKSKLLLKRILKLPLDLLCLVGRDGAWKLVYPTQNIIDHFLKTRTATEIKKIRDQLSQPFLQRIYNEGRVNPIYHYLLDPDSLLETEDYQDSLFKIDMQVGGKRQRANLTFFQGRLFSVELPKPLKYYEGKDLVLGAVTRGKPSNSITRAIDRLEHGRDEGEV